MYLDSASDRMQSAHEARVEELRMGYIFSRDAKAYQKWRGAPKRIAKRAPLVGDALEAAVMGIARIFPQNVVRVDA